MSENPEVTERVTSHPNAPSARLHTRFGAPLVQRSEAGKAGGATADTTRSCDPRGSSRFGRSRRTWGSPRRRSTSSAALATCRRSASARR
jgi:hypothetical protein